MFETSDYNYLYDPLDSVHVARTRSSLQGTWRGRVLGAGIERTAPFSVVIGYCLCAGKVVTLEVLYNRQMTLASIQTHYAVIYPPVACTLYLTKTLAHLWSRCNVPTTLDPNRGQRSRACRGSNHHLVLCVQGSVSGIAFHQRQGVFNVHCDKREREVQRIKLKYLHLFAPISFYTRATRINPP